MRGAEKRNIINGDQITPQELSQEFLDTANKASEEEEHKRYAEIGLEVAEQNFHKAQGLMERSVMWDDGNREMAVKVNRYSQEKEGTVPPNLNEAFQSIAGYARDFRDSNDPSDIRSAEEIEAIVIEATKPGVKGVEDALKYMEGLLRSAAISGRSFTREGQDDVLDKRGIRDALYQEKIKREENLQKESVVEKELAEKREETKRKLVNLFNNGGMYEQDLQRQRFLSRVDDMSRQEVIILESEMKQINREYKMHRDSKKSAQALRELTGKSFSVKGRSQAEKKKTNNQIEDVRKQIGAASESISKEDVQVPEDRRERVQFFKENFGAMNKATLAEFQQGFTPELQEKYKAYVLAEIQSLVSRKSPGSTYVDTVASVLGNNPGILMRIVALQDGRAKDVPDLLREPFSEVAEKYLEIQLPEDYSQHFTDSSSYL